jgi:Domain of unknown function (DUF3597)
MFLTARRDTCGAASESHWQPLAIPEEKTMSIFGSIVSAIFGSHAAAAAPGAAPAKAPGASSTASPPLAPAAGAQPMSRVEVEAMIAKIPGAQSSEYNWKQSIVDLMKLLKLDSSLNARKQLAQELGYTGALDGSAEMNVWLHRQVMTKLAEGGGKVPEALKHA